MVFNSCEEDNSPASSGNNSMTYIPDDNFEAYLEANGMGNGVANDDYVNTANINTVTFLSVNNLNISDLTGIEDFTTLTELSCQHNQLTSLDVSQNTTLTGLWPNNNQLTTLDVSNNTALNLLDCTSNQLTSLDVSQNTALSALWCSLNKISSLDVSADTALSHLVCASNQLTSLDLRNGNNWTNIEVWIANNPNLTCISVDDPVYSTANWLNRDPQHYFSANCP